MINIPESELVQRNISYHSTLNPAVWDLIDEQYVLKPEVRKRLLEIANIFITFLNIPKLHIEDIVLTGSNANYNWTKFSDFDIHLIVDYDKVANVDIATELFNAKKSLWNEVHDITIRGHDVELYVEDTDNPPVSQGVFSILHNQWIKVPKYHKPKIDVDAVNAKVVAIMREIDNVVDIDTDDVEIYNKLTDKIKKMRKSGLAKEGEYSVENLAFKILRNEGYLAKLWDAKTKALNRKLTLERAKLRKPKGSEIVSENLT